MLYVICYMRILWHAWRMEVGGYALTQILDDRRSYQLEYRFVLDPSLHEYHKSELNREGSMQFPSTESRPMSLY